MPSLNVFNTLYISKLSSLIYIQKVLINPFQSVVHFILYQNLFQSVYLLKRVLNHLDFKGEMTSYLLGFARNDVDELFLT